MLAVVFVILIVLMLFGWYIPNKNYRDHKTTNTLSKNGPTRIRDIKDFAIVDEKYSSKSQNNVALGNTVVLTDSIISSDWWLYQNIGDRLDSIYCFGYRIGTSMDDEWTVRINNFKQGRERDIKKAIRTLRTASPSLFERIGINPETTTVIPVLGSQETSANSRSKISRLAKAIADGADAKFTLHCLSKNKHDPLHLQTDRYARDQALNKANHQALEFDHHCENVIIVDDIVTRGKTMSAVANAIHRSNPLVEIFGFALGRHVRRDYLPVSFDEANAEIPDELAEIWDQA
ncbi:MAG: phosphoribosyltransferase [Bacteroidetes bacterium]|nr:phosphoribosyltransferase [Bacteroidota bacterium]